MTSSTGRATAHDTATVWRRLAFSATVAVALWAVLDLAGIDVGGAVGVLPGGPALVALVVGIVAGRVLRRSRR